MTKPSSEPATTFEPEFVAALKQMFEQRIRFNEVLGLKVERLDAQGAGGHIAMKPDLIGHFSHNRLHGGVISAGLDAMAGLALMAAIGARHMDETVEQRLHRFMRLGTIDLRVDYLRQAVGPLFSLSAEVLRLGSRVATTRMEFRDAQGVLLATGAAAYIVS